MNKKPLCKFCHIGGQQHCSDAHYEDCIATFVQLQQQAFGADLAPEIAIARLTEFIETLPDQKR